MRLLLLGAPGSGKGTQATQLAAHYGIAHIASGDLLRHEVATGTPAGQEAAAYLDRGDLVPDSVVLEILRGPLADAARQGGYILDGFPRTVEQAEAADAAGQAPNIAAYLRVPRDILVRRLLGRAARVGRSDESSTACTSSTSAPRRCSTSTTAEAS
jgi:adenylate kinase